jgi:hypothetical protein
MNKNGRCPYLLVLFLVVWLQPLTAGAVNWQVKNSRHFSVYHQNASVDYLNQVILEAENYYKKITNELGFQRFDFWLWDDRCKIFLYPDRGSYLESTGSLAWSRAHVDVIKKEIITYKGQKEFFNNILPHEMAHIIFREMIGYDKKIPLWLDEGVAMLFESDRENRLLFIKKIVLQGKYIPLSQLSDVSSYGNIDPGIFYNQSASLVAFLLNRYGRNSFVNFCRQLRDRQDWQKALRRVYRFNSLEEFQEIWLEDIQ